MNILKSTLLVAVAAALVGCGSDDDSKQGPSGCTEEPCLATPSHGFQLRTAGVSIAPGEDVEYCEVVQLPGDASESIYVNRLESTTANFAHHFTVVAVTPGSGADKSAVVGQRTVCVAGPPGDYWDYKAVTNSQHPMHQDVMPPGGGRKFQGGQKLIFNYHYLNATDKPILGRAAVNFHTVEASEVKFEPQDFGFINMGTTFSVPPKGKAATTAQCEFTSDITIYKLIRHTHQWGTDFNVWYAGGARDGELVFTTPSFDQTDYLFPQPIQVKAGEGFRFECNYQNTEETPLTFGPLATNEMCILMGVWWPTNAGETAPPQSCVIP